MSTHRAFSVDMKPQAKERARKGANNVWYTPENTKNAQELIRLAYLNENRLCEPITGAVRAGIKVFASLPKSTPKSVEQKAYVVKPDADNLAKLILDALNGVAYKDDSQVVDLRIVKMPRRRYGREGIIVRIEEVSGLF